MPNVYNSAAVIIPPEDKWGPIQEIRSKFDRQINRWMPHINIFFPFKPKALFSELEPQFSRICSEIKPFRLSLKRIRYFEHKSSFFTMFLDPEPNGLIVNLHQKLLAIVPDCNDLNKFKGGFRPHLSVGQIQDKKKLKPIVSALQTHWKELEFEVKCIHFIARESERSSEFRIEKSIELKKKL